MPVKSTYNMGKSFSGCNDCVHRSFWDLCVVGGRLGNPCLSSTYSWFKLKLITLVCLNFPLNHRSFPSHVRVWEQLLFLPRSAARGRWKLGGTPGCQQLLHLSTCRDNTNTQPPPASHSLRQKCTMAEVEDVPEVIVNRSLKLWSQSTNLQTRWRRVRRRTTSLLLRSPSMPWWKLTRSRS